MVTTPLDKQTYLQTCPLETWPTKIVSKIMDDAAFNAAFNVNWAWVCRALFRIVGDWDEAEDLALDVFYRLHERPPKAQGQLESWLYRVATNVGLNALRARQRRRKYEAAAEALKWQRAAPTDPAREVERRDAQRRVRHVLAQMRRRNAQLLLLRHGGLSYREIAAVLNVVPSSIGKMLARAEKDFERRYRALFGETDRGEG